MSSMSEHPGISFPVTAGICDGKSAFRQMRLQFIQITRFPIIQVKPFRNDGAQDLQARSDLTVRANLIG